jgi:proton-dependent oligopeptide transporter, POT family
MTIAEAAEVATKPEAQKHPKGLYVLFATEMWERFSFYSMLAMFTLYLRDPNEGFGWTAAEATALYSNYLMFVYASPLVGGWLADKFLGYRKSVMIGGLFFMAGHLLLSFRSLPVVYAALACLVIGNGFFKPNVSTMVGNLYPEGSPLKDRAYSIFYMGINVGAFLAPIVAELVKTKFGFHPAFAVAAFGMLISVSILWRYKGVLDESEKRAGAAPAAISPAAAAVATDLPPVKAKHANAIDSVPDWKRIGALIVIYLIVIVFWMIFHQNGSTLTYWADENTNWSVTGIISNSINPGYIILLTFPLVWFWKKLSQRGIEPSTPGKIMIGMTLTGVSFFIMYLAAKAGGDYGKVSPLWLLGTYAVISLGELMLSPMGLSLVSKVAPMRHRGIMMGGWFVATAIGNKLTMIGVYWEEWRHSTFFAVLGAMALVMAVVLAVLIRPLKKAMPGV